jgi:hypothetical protein
MGEAVRELKGARTPWLAGYRIKVLDGNCIEATQHRLAPLRRTFRTPARPSRRIFLR